jgi:hypothetical protein
VAQNTALLPAYAASPDPCRQSTNALLVVNQLAVGSAMGQSDFESTS